MAPLAIAWRAERTRATDKKRGLAVLRVSTDDHTESIVNWWLIEIAPNQLNSRTEFKHRSRSMECSPPLETPFNCARLKRRD